MHDPGARAHQRVRPVAHVLGAGALGLLGALLGVPPLVAATFGGYGVVLLVVAVLAALVAALAVALDVVLGPGRGGRSGSVVRGVVLGLGGSLLTVGLALLALEQDLGDSWPVLLRYLAAALPFMAIAALQWPGPVRIGTAVLVVGVLGSVGVPRLVEARQDDREDRIRAAVGTTARPWVTEVEGLRGLAPQTTGSEYLSTGYRRTDGEPPVLHLLRMPDSVAPGDDPCGGEFYTPEGTFEATTCEAAGAGTWRRTADPSWQQLVRRVDGTWLAATARPDVPEQLLDGALDAARPMSDEDYEAWLEVMLPTSSGS